jgi:hypothetical protein
MYHTMWAIVHTVALWLWWGQWWNWSRMVHSFGMFRWSIRMIAAMQDHVHFQMSVLGVQSVRRCNSVSTFAHLSHWLVAARRIATRRSFAGMRSWITLYHVNLSVSDIQAMCRFLHTRSQLFCGRCLTILISLLPVAARSIVCNVLYMRFLKAFVISSLSGGGIYAISRAYICRYSNWCRLLLVGGGLACGPVRFHLLSHDAVAVPFLLLCCHIQFISSVLHFAAMSTNAHLLCLVFLSVEVSTLKIILCHMNQSIAVVGRFVLATEGGKIWVMYHIRASNVVCTYCARCAIHSFLAYANLACAWMRPVSGS